jgi:hypothetical protein
VNVECARVCVCASTYSCRSSGCVHLAVCDPTDHMQAWSHHAGGILSTNYSASSQLCVDVTANRLDAGAWWNLIPCANGQPGPEEQFAFFGERIICAGSLLCSSADTPGTPPPPPPPPPTPPPSGQLMLTQVVVETLAVNAQYSPLPSYAYTTYASTIFTQLSSIPAPPPFFLLGTRSDRAIAPGARDSSLRSDVILSVAASERTSEN